MENKLSNIFKRFSTSARGRFAWILLCMFVVSVVPAHAALVGIDQILCQVDCTGLNGTLNITVTGAAQLTVVMTNTSDPAAASGAAALLSGFGFEMGGIRIISGSADITAGSVAVNFDPLTTPLSTEWGWANAALDGYTGTGIVPTTDVVSARENTQTTLFQGPEQNIDGPDFGAIATGADAGGQEAVRNSITFVLNLDGSANTALANILAGNVFLAFGSPDTHTGIIPEPSTYALYGLGISMLLVSGWWQKRRKQQGGMAAI